MKTGALLTRDRIRIPLHAAGVEEALALFRGGAGASPPPDPPASPLLPQLQRGEGGRIRLASAHTVVILLDGAPEDRIHLGVSPEPLEGIEDATPRIVVLVERRQDSGIGDDGMGKLLALLSNAEVEDAILSAPDAPSVLGIEALVGLGLSGPLRVSDALVPMAYRVYPDAPVGEVLDLMARKGITAVPVVGESLQMVGILTAGDGLRLFLDRGARPDVTTREVMTRAVLCVTEEQDLVDATRTMVNRNLRQLPVIRDGEVVGFLTRESILRTLYGSGRRLGSD
jgi:CBS domain-containing protein